MAVNSFVMLALGAYRFSVASGGFQGSNLESSWRWEALDVIGCRPALQYIGPGEEKLTIEGLILPAYRGGLGQVDAMRAEAGRGMPLTLVDGTGRYYGQFVIERVGERKSVFMQDGAPRRIEFTIELTRYA